MRSIQALGIIGAMKMLLAVALALLMGCSMFGQLEPDLRPYQGRNVAELSAVIGEPDGEVSGQGQVRYVWVVDHRFTVAQTVRTQLDPMLRPPFNTTVSSVQETPMRYVCKLQVVTDAKGMIQSFHARGNEGCQRFATALERQ